MQWWAIEKDKPRRFGVKCYVRNLPRVSFREVEVYLFWITLLISKVRSTFNEDG